MLDALTEFLDDLTHVQRKSPHTIKSYEADLRQLHGWLDDKGHKAAKDIARIDVYALRGYLAARHEKDAVTTVLRRLSAIKSFLKFCVRQGRLKESPAALLESPRRPKQLPRTVSVDEAFALCTAPDAATASGLRDRALIELLYGTGIRVAELVSLDIGGVDLEDLSVRVIGKGSKERVVPFHQTCADVLRVYLEQARPQLATDDAGAAFFVGDRGGRLSDHPSHDPYRQGRPCGPRQPPPRRRTHRSRLARRSRHRDRHRRAKPHGVRDRAHPRFLQRAAGHGQ